MAELGHNQPPSQIEFTRTTSRDLSQWLYDNPVIQEEEGARQAKLWRDRAKLCIADLEAERTKKVTPLNEQVKQINETYKDPRTELETVARVLNDRLKDYIEMEELRRAAVAEQARRAREEAEARARAAEAAESDSIEDARQGVVADVAAATIDADKAFEDYQKAVRAEAIAEQETHVKLGGGLRRAASLRSLETLEVVEPMVAATAIGWTESLVECIRKEARKYREKHGSLPPGVISKTERKL